MFQAKDLKNIVHKPELTQRDLLIIAIGCDGGTAKSNSEIKNLLVNEGGLRAARAIPVASRLGKLPILAVNVNGKWELNDNGVARLKELGLTTRSAKAIAIDDKLDHAIDVLNNEDTRDFLDEALQCYRHEYYRAATVLSWVGAMHCMFVYVHTYKLKEFNDAAIAKYHNPPKHKWKNVKTVEEFANIKELTFLDVVTDIGLIGKSLRKKLGEQLDLRNACSHPNSFKLGEQMVAAHLELLILNVFQKFS